MKSILEFNLPEEQEEFRDAVEGSSWHVRFDEVWDQVFRPYHKHGYHDVRLQNLVEKHPEVGQAIELLGEIYQRIRRDEY